MCVDVDVFLRIHVRIHVYAYVNMCVHIDVCVTIGIQHGNHLENISLPQLLRNDVITIC